MIKITNILLKIFLTVSSAVLLCACNNNQPLESSNSLHDSRIVVQTPDLYNWMQMEFINQVRQRGDLIEFEARFTNTTSYEQNNINYRIDWFDANGFAINTILSTWNTAHFTPYGSIAIKGIAPNAKSMNYQIRFKQDGSLSTPSVDEIE